MGTDTTFPVYVQASLLFPGSYSLRLLAPSADNGSGDPKPIWRLPVSSAEIENHLCGSPGVRQTTPDSATPSGAGKEL